MQLSLLEKSSIFDLAKDCCSGRNNNQLTRFVIAYGSVVAIGAPDNDCNGDKSGHVRIYQNNSGTWQQVGSDIDGEASGDRSGNSVSLFFLFLLE